MDKDVVAIFTTGPEHIVHIDGVTDSSPVATTTRLASLLARFLFKNRQLYRNSLKNRKSAWTLS